MHLATDAGFSGDAYESGRKRKKLDHTGIHQIHAKPFSDRPTAIRLRDFVR